MGEDSIIRDHSFMISIEGTRGVDETQEPTKWKVGNFCDFKIKYINRKIRSLLVKIKYEIS